MHKNKTKVLKDQGSMQLYKSNNTYIITLKLRVHKDATALKWFHIPTEYHWKGNNIH